MMAFKGCQGGLAMQLRGYQWEHKGVRVVAAQKWSCPGGTRRRGEAAALGPLDLLAMEAVQR